MNHHSVPTLISLSLHLVIIAAIGTISVRNIKDARSIIRVTLLAPPGGGSQGGSPAVNGPPPAASEPVRVAPPPPPPRSVPAAVRPRPIVPVKNVQPKAPPPRPDPKVESAPPVAAPAAAAPPSDGLAAVGSGTGSAAGSGSGTGRGNGSGPGRGAGKGTIMGAYLGDLRERIERAKHYPPLARRRGVEGRVAVAFEVTSSGQVRALRLAGASHPLLDEAALLAVETAAPFPQLPPEAGTDALRVEVALRFTLEDQR